MQLCASCGRENAPDANFCAGCGERLTAAAPVNEERRVISVIFVDLVGFTSTAEKLDPEDVQAILAPYYERVRTEIESFGGVVEKFIGDAVMGVFGAPTAYGDDPERAVRAAIAVRDGMLGFNPDGRDQELAFRIAVNTGDALVSLGARPELGQAMVAGDVVNTASRLQSFAPDNGILVGADTYACTRHVITYAPMPPVAAKGKSEPVEAWLAVDACADPGERPLNDAGLVGRSRELRLLEEAWERAVADRSPQLLTVFGPPGVGKTRLGLEFARHVADSGGSTLRGRSLPYRESSAYGAFADQVQQLAGIFASDVADVAMKKLREFALPLLGADGESAVEHLGILLGFTPEHEAADRETLFFSARRFVEAVVNDRPTLLIFEDIHWADQSLLDLIELFAARLHDLPVLILTMSRPELHDVRPGWAHGLQSYMAVPLQPLGAEAARELASRLLGTIDAATLDQRAHDLALTAEGNPLFIEQLAAALGERAAGETALPTTIRGIVAARLDALPPSERSVLLGASVIGRVFWRGVLERMLGAGMVSGVLNGLESRDLIRREMVSIIKGEEQYAFKHVMIRDTAYETLPRKKRQEMHATVAAYLEETVSPEGEAGAQLARHWRGAGRDDLALSYLIAAADQAGRGWAKGHAAALYGEAIQCAPPELGELIRSLKQRQGMAVAMQQHVRDMRLLLGEDGSHRES